MKKGVFCISFDIDLLWGRHDLNYEPFKKPLGKARKIFNVLLSKLEEDKIPATWAIIGHLFLESCKSEKGVLHPEIVRPKYNWYKEEWFSSDPCSNLKKDPLWYGKDIVEALKKSSYQEIGSHSFSHVIFGDKGCSKRCADSEVLKCLLLAKKEGIKLESFVFPRNKIGHLDVLKKYNFKAFRGAQKNFESKNKIIQLAKFLSPTPPPVYLPKTEQGLVNIPASMYFISARGPRRFIPRQLIFTKAKLGIDKAIKEKKIFHIWAHLEDFAEKYSEKMRTFNEIIDYAKYKRDEGKIEIKTMRDVAKTVLK